MVTRDMKRENFRRLATRRTNAVIDKLRVLGHCSNPWQYEYTEEEVQKMFKAINDELKAVKAKFRNSHGSQFEL